MSEQVNRLAELSPAEKRTLLADLLREKASRSEARYPLSDGQRALWFMNRLAPASSTYTVAYGARIRSELDVSALQRAFQILVERHAVLRTTFTSENGSPAQIVHGYRHVSFTQVGAAGWSDEKLNAQLTSSLQRPFDLEAGPLMRVELFSRSGNEHVLLLAIHHIVSDGWSFDLLLSELGALYASIAAGATLSHSSQQMQYTNYVAWQQTMLDGPEGARLLEYWRSVLGGKIVPLDLPTDRPRAAKRYSPGGTVELELEGILSARLGELARAERTTLYTVLLAAFQVLLHRYSGQNEILVGSPAAGRTRQEFNEIVGYFVNPVVLRADFSDNPTFSMCLVQAQRTVQGALEHQDYPFLLLAKELHVERDENRAPVFQVVFDFQKVARTRRANTFALSKEAVSQPQGLALEPILLEQGSGEFDLILHMFETDDKLIGTFQYSADLFDKATIERMRDSFIALLEGIVANANEPVATLPIMSQALRQEILETWNQNAVEFPRNECFHQLFETQAAHHPDAPALVFEGRSMTYSELNRAANQLANYLQRKSVRNGDLVGLSFERGPEMVMAVLAVMKAGAAYVPLDPTYPSDRLAYMLRDSQVPLLVTQTHLVGRFADSGTTTVCLEREMEQIAGESAENPALALSSEQLAYAIYTSGSTGKPKGVLLQHCGLRNLADFQRRIFQLGPGDRVLQFSSFSFDAWVWEMAMSLGSGATLHLARQETLIASLERELRDRSINVVTLPPSALMAMSGTELPALRIIVAAGEACPRDLVSTWGNGRTFFNAYGPTEATVCACIAECTPDDLLPPTIGRPISNFETYILDPHLQAVPIGIPGELYLGGIGLARGYLNQPELTAERFIRNPFRSDPNARLYRTGDLVRYLPDGRIDYLGRMDTQVKLRGFRIELGEIETVLAQHPAIRGAVVIADSNSRDKRLIAYLVPAQKRQLPVSELRNWLMERLPGHMIPSTFIFMEAFPLTSNGKINRAALAATGGTGPELNPEYVAPATKTEQAIVEIWQDVLERPHIGVLDDFFEIGGHSLLATRVISRMRQTFEIEIPLSRFLQARNSRELAEYIQTVSLLQQNASKQNGMEREVTDL